MQTRRGTLRGWRRTLVAATIAGLAVAGFVPLVARAQSPADGAAKAMIDSARRGLPTLRLDGRLSTIARRQSERMRSAGRLFHNAALQKELSAVAPSWVVAGENVGVGASVSEVHRAFLASPEHRRNILERGYDSVGIAVVTADDGRLYVTQVFARLGASVRSAPSSAASPCRRIVAEDGSVVPASFYGSC